MNGGPYRTPSSSGRVINRDGGATSSSYRQSEDSQPLPAREEPSRGASGSSSGGSYVPVNSNKADFGEKKPKNGMLWTVVIIMLVAILATLGFLAFNQLKSTPTGIDSSRYQAVFLSNGQIYFGKLESFNDESFKITKVYYPEVKSEDSTSEEVDGSETDSQNSIKLMRVIDGVHGPDDEMIIIKSQILYYENLKADSQVAKLIEQNN